MLLCFFLNDNGKERKFNGNEQLCRIFTITQPLSLFFRVSNTLAQPVAALHGSLRGFNK